MGVIGRQEVILVTIVVLVFKQASCVAYGGEDGLQPLA